MKLGEQGLIRKIVKGIQDEGLYVLEFPPNLGDTKMISVVLQHPDGTTEGITVFFKGYVEGDE